MKFFETLTSSRTVVWGSLILSVIIIYPNIGNIIWSLCTQAGKIEDTTFVTASVLYFFYRYFFFVGLTWMLIRINIKKAGCKLKERFRISFFITLAGYAVYVLIALSVEYIIRRDCFTQLLILQFLIAWLVPVLIGQIYYLTVIQRETEKEIEKLRSENLQSRVDALSNQINPHFFFNSLNGITALVAANRNEETTAYVTKLSTIFRYILQSDKKGLVRLKEELTFLDAYRYLLEVRYSGKISFLVNVPVSGMELQLPVLSLLPLIENVVKHNIIDSEHKMIVDIYLSENRELKVRNPVYRKYNIEYSHGIGLTNLSARYKLLTGKDIEVNEEAGYFMATLPLKKAENESTDC
ncbi:MAG: histidine kinase [Candidatus Azobacteroides sp.]|nr:histidine kinase [Candidatus Azobacteroides sp.]